ncbi:MAG: polysaccharide biosynthesis C-terminal domain-containing protein [Planctomycetaceae bacterium]|nr:polysaccharide biosynthesis C-terminal domain-containing protein [Planctomycetaceae bacterium]
MNWLILLYGITNGLSRGVALLYTPLLSGWLGLDDFGLFVLVQTGGQVLVGLLSLNGGTAVLREGAIDQKLGIRVFLQFAAVTMLLGTGLYLVTRTLDATRLQWLSFLVAIGLSESLQNLAATWLRSRDANAWFIGSALTKAVCTLLLVLWARHQNWGLRELFQGQLLIGAVLVGIPVAAAAALQRRDRNTAVVMPAFCGLLAYSLPLIPHSIGQWVISGSDRFVIKWIHGDAAVGVYSLAYTAGMVVLILNTGLGMVLPQEIVRHYEEWKTGPRRRQLIVVYSIATVAVLGLMFTALELDCRYFHMTGCNDPSLPLMVGLIGAGLYCHGLYYIYGNFYFYHRATGQLAVQTVAAAMVNVALTLLLVPWLGPLGAAISTLVTYLVYLGAVVFGLRKLEPQVLSLFSQDLGLVAGPAFSIGLVGWCLMLSRGLIPA